MSGGRAYCGFRNREAAPTAQHKVTHIAPHNCAATAFGFVNLLGGIVTLVSSVIAGAFSDRLGAAAIFYAAAGFCVLNIALFFFGRTHKSGTVR